MSTSYLRPLSFGEVLDGAFSVYRRHFPSMFLAAFIPYVPVAILMAFTMMSSGVVVGGKEVVGLGMMGGGFFLLIVAVYVAPVVAWGAVTYMFSQAYVGRPAPLGDAFRVAFSRFFPLLGAAFLMFLAAGFGFLFFVIPGFILLAMFFLISPAVVLERQGPGEALSRSRDLTRGALGYTCGLMFVSYLIAFLPTLVIGAGNFVLSSTLDPAAAARAGVLANVVSTAVSALTLPFSVGVTVMFYYDRRVRNEALDVQMAAEGLAFG